MIIYRCLVVDDEKFARFDLIQQLNKIKNIEILGEAESLSEARLALKTIEIDLIFIDIQMTGETGFDLLPDIPSNIKVIFVTAYDQYAIDAFEVNAFDYLLKPVNPERLQLMLRKLNDSHKEKSVQEQNLRYDDCLFFKGIKNFEFLRIKNISHIGSAGDYTEIFTIDGEKKLIHKTLKEWESRLPNQYFVRIHREHIINIDQVERIEKMDKTELSSFLKDYQNPLAISRKYFSKIKEILS